MSRKKTHPERIATPAPAPGQLELLQAFANTDDRKAKSDAFASPRHLSDWLAGRGLVAAGTRLAAADLERARDVRAGVRALVAASGGAKVLGEVVERLDRASRGARARVRFQLDGSCSFKSESFDEALGLVVALVAASRLAGLWERLKTCANPDCRAVFYDYSNKRTTKWCTRRCGDVVRARKYRRGRGRHQSIFQTPPGFLERMTGRGNPADEEDP